MHTVLGCATQEANGKMHVLRLLESQMVSSVQLNPWCLENSAFLDAIKIL